MENRIVCGNSNKRAIIEVSDGEDDEDRVYKFRILLGPSRSAVDLTLRNPKPEIPREEFLLMVKEECGRARWRSCSLKGSREIDWSSKDLFFEDGNEQRLRGVLNLRNFKPYKMYMLRLCDGSNVGAETFENMWDLTPDTELLSELPEEYTFETALADLIDNSLQAVWSNGKQDIRLISVDIEEDRISIFDSGPGMDGSDENSIVKWGKIGASLHRSSKRQAIGCKPPYLKPYFGMFGYGGPMATMKLGRRAVVSSKTKESKKVFSLHLEREVLLSRSGSDLTWRTAGGIRDPLEEEIEKSIHGSFTKVEIFEPRKGLGMYQLQCRLKDIYFPYIQCDLESSSKKILRPVLFQVNGTDLAEIDGGEVATTYLHSSNGPDFVLELHCSRSQDNASTKSPGSHTEANARLKCVYFPIIKGKETIELILEKLEKAECGVQENFDTFSRVSIRRLGRLLPDARWAWLPFMEPRIKKGDRGFLLRRCCMRVKCFIETDAGFSPTPSKTDLAHHSPFTIALKNLGSKSHEKQKEVDIQIFKDGKRLNDSQLEKLYEGWILDMHESYDKDSGDDPPVLIVNPQDKKALGVTSDVLRVHKVLDREGVSWRHGQKIKILKGGCAGFSKNNVYATIEYFIFGGLEGDACGEAQMICRPLDVPDENGCVLEENGEDTRIHIRKSKSLPISVIDSGKCLAVKSTEWSLQLEKRQGVPSTIDLLTAKDCQELELGGELPVGASIPAGHPPPAEILAVIRPASFVSYNNASKGLDQKFIVRDNFEMSMEIKFRYQTKGGTEDQHVYSTRIAPSFLKGFRGIYIFPLKSKHPQLFNKAGVYTFLFSLISDAQKESTCKSCLKRVIVKGSSEVGKWHLQDQQNPCCHVRVGSRFPPFSIACYDIYDSQVQFSCLPKVNVKLQTDKGVFHQVEKVTTTLSTDRLYLKVENIVIASNQLDKIRPSYEATLMICSQDEVFSVSIPCQVTPGSLHHVSLLSPIMDYQLFPGSFIKELTLEMFDAFGNHVKSGLEVQMVARGFLIIDQTCRKCKVNDEGCIDYGGLLKVIAGYGENASISVVYEDVVVFQQEFAIEKRVLRLASKVYEYYTAGSRLENIAFEVVNSEGIVDVAIHDDDKCGHSHTLTIDSLTTDGSIRYAFKKGRCNVPVIILPLTEGSFCFDAVHSRHPELRFTVKIHLLESPKVEPVVFQSPCSNKQLVACKGTLPNSFQSPSSDNQLVTFKGTPPDLMPCMHTNVQPNNSDMHYTEADYDIIRKFEADLMVLDDIKKDIKKRMSTLQASLEPCLSGNLECLATREEMMKRIESRAHSVAGLLCCLSRELSLQDSSHHFMKDVVGPVALLGTVRTSALSRILAEYLGEDQMLAVVCRSYGAAAALENYKQDGEEDCMNALHAEAVRLGRSIKGRLLAVCLDDIRPFSGNIEDGDQQRKLALPAPTSSSGHTPTGFLGHAVNMIDLGPDHVLTMTSAGHGLRETVLYSLFGELQVYETRKHMKDAYGCEFITQGAVSLDGGVLIKNGIISLGYEKPEICFPVASSERERGGSLETWKELESLNEKLRTAESCIEKRMRSHEKATKKLNRKLEKHKRILLDSIEQ